jgi:hypothetical protein
MTSFVDLGLPSLDCDRGCGGPEERDLASHTEQRTHLCLNVSIFRCCSGEIGPLGVTPLEKTDPLEMLKLPQPRLVCQAEP